MGSGEPGSGRSRRRHILQVFAAQHKRHTQNCKKGLAGFPFPPFNATKNARDKRVLAFTAREHETSGVNRAWHEIKI
jgi:hypothetical protein